MVIKEKKGKKTLRMRTQKNKEDFGHETHRNVEGRERLSTIEFIHFLY